MTPRPASQTWMVPSSVADASRWPSALHVRSIGAAFSNGNVNNSAPSVAPSTFTLPSRDAEASRRPSGLQSIALIRALCGLQLTGNVSRIDVEYLDQALRPSAGQHVSTGTPGKGRHARQCTAIHRVYA